MLRRSTRSSRIVRFRQLLLNTLGLGSASNRLRPSWKPGSRKAVVEQLEDRRVLATMFAVDTNNNLLTFDSSTPGTINNNVAITGLAANSIVAGIDVRPANGQLYAFGLVDDGATRTGQIYTLAASGAATAIGAPFSTTLSDTDFWGMDFNPTVDRLRITNRDGQNLRVNPNTGALAGTDTNLSVTGLNGVAYDRNVAGATQTTLYAYNFDTDELITIGGIDGVPSPNGGTVSVIGGSGVSIAGQVPMDIESGTGVARISGSVGGNTSLFTVNLATGAATNIGAIGGGALSIRGLTHAFNIGSLTNNTVSISGTNADDDIRLEMTQAGALLVTQNGIPTIYPDFVNSSPNAFIAIDTGLGNDKVTVDSNRGAVVRKIHYTGGSGDDALTLQGGTATSNIYGVGPTADQGRSEIIINGETQLITFEGLEPVIDLVAGPLTIDATAADNAINYSPGSVAANGLVTIDNFESIEFSNKTILTLNAGSGSDTINLNNPSTPTGLTGIVVNGGDPAASDELIVNGTIGNNNITYTTSDTIGSGTVAIVGSATIDFTTVESLMIDGQGGTDTLTHATPAGGHRNTFTPGTSPDAGTIRSSRFGAGTQSVPLTFAHIGALGTVTIAGAGAGTDIFEVNGTNSIDTFALTGSNVQILNATSGFTSNLISTPGVFAIELRGLDSDDMFNVSGTLASYTGGVVVDGGSPSASDVLNLSGSTGAVVVNFASNTTVTGYGATITTSSIETLNAIAGNNNLTVNGTLGDDVLDVTPTSADSVTFRLKQSNPSIGLTPVVNGSQIGTLSVNLLTGNDSLVVNGTTEGEVINVTSALVTVASLKPVNYLGAEALSVFAHQGVDIITVTPSAIPVFIDGGDPIGTTPGDSLMVNAAIGFFAGPEADEGGVLTGGGTVNFDHIEAPTLAGVAGCGFLILGTNADDDINVIARDVTTTAGADGIQDFTFSINGGMSVAVLNQPDLFIDAMAGDDDIVIRAGAPNGADWDVNVRVAGGSPSIGAPLEADRLVVETPNVAAGFDNIVFNPTGADTGNMVIDEDASGIYDAGGTDSLITFGAFFFECPPLDFTYTSTSGGVELVQYNGEGAPSVDDNLTINGTALDDTTVVNPTGIGSGTFTSGASPLFQFQSFDNLTVNPGSSGFDRVEINGTAGPDTVTSNANTVTLGGAVTLGQGIDQLDINTFDGNDNVDLDLQLVGLRKVVSLGMGNDTSDLSGVLVDPTDPIIYGGDGDDNIVGSPNIDNIFGGSGTDIILGLGNNDYIEGGDGNDTITGGTGNDILHGGDGSDVIIWNNGDNTDVVEGGTGDDRAVVNGAGAGDTFTVFADSTNPSRIAFNRTNLVPFALDIADVEEFDINSGNGADSITVGDLTTTALRDLDLDLGVEAGVADTVTINGRNVDDNIQITGSGNVMTIAGLRYDIRVSNALAGDNDDFTFNANAGHDEVAAADALGAFFTSSNVAANNRFRIIGGSGNDRLIGFGSLDGQLGDDTLIGSSTIAAANGNQILLGGDGDDTFVGGAGDDTIDGGAGFDTILVDGTGGNDAIDVNQSAATTLVHTVNGNAQTDTLVLSGTTRTVERVSVVAGAGDDTIRVSWADALGTDADVNSLRVDVDGGLGNTSDRLGVIDAGTGDLTLYQRGTTDDSGQVAVGPGNAEPLVSNFINVEYAQPVAGNGGDLVVFKHDPFELNNSRSLATYLGAGDALNVDPNINPGLDPIFGLPADEDWYRVVAERTGVLDFQVYFRQVPALANGRLGLPNSGNLSIAVTDEAGNVVAGFGANDATSDERVRIPAVAGETYYLRVFADGAAINTYNITVDNYQPPTPFDLELLDNPVGDPPPANSDTGRSQLDNVTRDNTPTIIFRLDDAIFLNDLPGNDASQTPPDEVIPIAHQAAAGTAGYRVAIFDEGPLPIPGTTAPQTPLGFATFVSAGVYSFTTPVLLDGSHFLTARVQMVDPATPQATGFGPRSQSLEIIVDTVVPPGFFGQVSLADTTQGLAAASDSGVVGDPATFVDRVTNDTTPSFYGRSEANAIVRVYAETNGVAGLQSSGAGADLFLGLTVADPLDGTNQFPGGQWSFTTPLDLNNPTLGFAKDGARNLYMTSEDLAGNVTVDAAADRLNIFIDTAGPQVTDIEITGSPAFNLFGLKPDNAVEGPTPRVDGLTIRVQDLPNRSSLDPNFLYAALQQTVAVAPGNFVLQGDHSGIIAIRSIVFIGVAPANGAIATGRIELEFFAPLPDDRFTLTIKDNVVDPVGNKLDGESNAAEPIGNPSFPSGDGQPGRDFVARFTVDSRPEVGTISQGLIYVDINGNFVFDPDGQDNDATNRDFVYQFGTVTDAHFAGNFSKVGQVASGYDKVGAYGSFNGVYSFALDTDDDGVADTAFAMPAAYQVNGIPVAGNFSNAKSGDEVGLFDGQFWYLDTNGNNLIDIGERFASNANGLPVVGDFNGDGNDDLALYNNDTNSFSFDTDRNGTADFTWNVRDDIQRFLGVRSFTDKPIAGDLNLDGIDDIGIWVKGREGASLDGKGEFFFWLSDHINANPALVFDAYSPAPLGNDLFAQYGSSVALPIFGNFDPPVAQTGSGIAIGLQNLLLSVDVDRDKVVTPQDVLIVINALNRNGGAFNIGSQASRILATNGGHYWDVSGDGVVAPIDVLQVINYLNRQSASGEGETGLDSDEFFANTVNGNEASFDDALASLVWDETTRRRRK